jgi:hypothetical protein
MYFKPTSKITNVKQNVISFLKKMTISKRQTLDSLLYRGNIHEVIHPGQTTIAEEIGCRRETVNINVADLQKANLISKITRPWNTCIYEINPVLNDPELRWELRNLFKSFKVRPLLPLLFIPFVNTSIIENRISFHNHTSHHISLSYPSSSFFNSLSITKAGKDGITKKDSLKNQRQYEQSSSGTSSHTPAHERNFTTLKKDSMNFEEILTTMHLNSTDKSFMTVFTLTVVEVMADKLKEYKTFKDFFEATIAYSKSVGQPVDYKKLGTIRASSPKKEFKNYKTAANNKVESKQVEQSQDADLGIVPSIDLTFDENVQQWSIYEQSAQHWANQSDKHKAILANRRFTFMKELDRHTPENLKRWRKRAKEVRELYPFTKEGIQSLGELFGIKPESTISNDIHIEQPKTQQIKKDSTQSNLVDISKYRTSENSQQIDEWLKDISYNPFNEIEDIDSPLQL